MRLSLPLPSSPQRNVAPTHFFDFFRGRPVFFSWRKSPRCNQTPMLRLLYLHPRCSVYNIRYTKMTRISSRFIVCFGSLSLVPCVTRSSHRRQGTLLYREMVMNATFSSYLEDFDHFPPFFIHHRESWYHEFGGKQSFFLSFEISN